eukprot:8420915-Pyramimonas_sp.AAC.1
MLIRGIEVPKMALWHDSGSSRRRSQVDTQRWNAENNAFGMRQNLQTVVVQRGSSLNGNEPL